MSRAHPTAGKSVLRKKRMQHIARKRDEGTLFEAETCTPPTSRHQPALHLQEGHIHVTGLHLICTYRISREFLLCKPERCSSRSSWSAGRPPNCGRPADPSPAFGHPSRGGRTRHSEDCHFWRPGAERGIDRDPARGTRFLRYVLRLPSIVDVDRPVLVTQFGYTVQRFLVSAFEHCLGGVRHRNAMRPGVLTRSTTRR